MGRGDNAKNTACSRKYSTSLRMFLENETSRQDRARSLQVNGIGSIVIISHEVCGGDEMSEVGEAACLDIIADGERPAIFKSREV